MEHEWADAEHDEPLTAVAVEEQLFAFHADEDNAEITA